MPVKLSFIIQNIVNHIIADLAVIDISIGIRQKTLDHRRLVTLKALSFLYIVTLVSKVFPLEMVKICLIVQAVTQSFYPGHLRSEERSVGKECVSKCRSRSEPEH